MRVVTWILRILSVVLFSYMSWLVYSALSGRWDWGAPYSFIVTVFRLLSLVMFSLCIMILNGLAAPLLGGQTLNDLLVGIYNAIALRLWYIQPYGHEGPLTNISEVWVSFQGQLSNIAFLLYDQLFTFLYFLCAGVGIALFLQSLVRMEQKFVGGAFVSIQLILVVAAFQQVFVYQALETDFFVFLSSNLQILAFVSFAYLEIGYQMIYSHSVGKPVEDREEHLKRQLLALRNITRRQDAMERGERASSTSMSRGSGATVFSYVREAIERKVLGTQELIENLDAVSDVRRLQIYVDELMSSDPNAGDELTAKAAAPSDRYILLSTAMGSVARFTLVILVSFFLLNSTFIIGLLSPPVGIDTSIDLLQPEIIMLYLVPVLLLFPFAATVIRFVSLRETESEAGMTKEEKEETKTREQELKRKKKEAEKARSERNLARSKRRKSPEEKDEWDRALEDTVRS